MVTDIPWENFGVAGVSVVAIITIVKLFLAQQTKISNQFIEEIQAQRKNFTETIDNHIKHDCELHEKTIETMCGVQEATKDLCKCLDRFNGK